MVQTHMTRLRLVYPPISNQEAEWVREVEDVEKLMRNSDFYAIAARPELLFSYVDTTTDSKLIITARIEDWFESQIVLSMPTLPNVAPFTDHIDIEFGPKLIRICTGDSPGSEPVCWNGSPPTNCSTTNPTACPASTGLITTQRR
jgi:hypothetical protein